MRGWLARGFGAGRDSPALREPAGRADPRLEHVRAGLPAGFVTAGRERGAVAHAGDVVALDGDLALGVVPDRAALAVDSVLLALDGAEPDAVAPLVDDRAGVGARDDMVGGAVPHRQAGPRSAMVAGRGDARGERAARGERLAAHCLECVGGAFGDRERQPGDDCAAGEQLGIASEHHHRHRAARRQAVDEHARRIEPVRLGDLGDHRGDRGGLAAPAPCVGGLIPVEAEVEIIAALLLGEEQGETVAVGELRPAAAAIVQRRILGAAVEHDHQWRTMGEFGGDVGFRHQCAGVGAEGGVGQAARAGA